MVELSIKERFVAHHIQPKRGEVWTCQLGENVGSEINKVRPVVILQNDLGNERAATTIVVPISSKQERQPTQVSIESHFFEHDTNLSGSVITEHIRSVSKARLGKKIGKLSEEAMRKVEEAVMVSLGMLSSKEKEKVS